MTLRDALSPLLDAVGLALSDEQIDKLQEYWEKVASAPLNLTAISDTEDAAQLHFADSLMPLCYDLIPENANLLDMGTGGGFPAVPLAVVRSDLSITAMDATEKKLRFIRENAPAGNITTVHARAEEAGRSELRETFGVVCARAVASLNVLLEYLAPFCAVGGRVIAYKAELTDEERRAGLAAAKTLGLRPEKEIPFTLPGRTPVSRTLVVFTKTSPTPKAYPRNNARQKPLGEAKK